MEAGHGAAGDTDLDGSEVGSGVESTDALNRLIFFADAVFAIAMTLLVLAIPRPEGGTVVRSFLEHQDAREVHRLPHQLLGDRALLVGTPSVVRVVRRYDYGVLLLNLLVLFCIAFLPYPSHPGRSRNRCGRDRHLRPLRRRDRRRLRRTQLVRRHASGLHGSLPRSAARLYVLRVLVVPTVFLLSIPVALAQHPTSAQKLWLLSFIVPALGSLFMRRQARGT